jgi:polyferredoxin
VHDARVMSPRTSQAERPQIVANLLGSPLARRLLGSPWFPLGLQLAALAALGWLAHAGWGVGRGLTADKLLVLRKTNLATLVVWGLWWPGMVAVAVVLGRAWCTVCPLELVNRAGDALARRAGWPRARLPGWVRAGWLTVAAYVTLQLLVAWRSIHRLPHATSLVLLSLVALALVSGLVVSDARSFCKGLCPASALLSAYGRHTPLQLDVVSPERCATCGTRECVRAERLSRLDARSCPSRLRPYARGPSDGCVLCLQCAKSCPHGNVGWGAVAREARSRRARVLEPFEAAFVAVAAGFVAHEVAGEVGWLEREFHRVPDVLQRFAAGAPFELAEALWFLALFPAVLWAAVAVVARLLGHRGGLGELVMAAATGAAPVVAAAHVAKATAKLVAWAGFLPLALRDPTGIRTASELGSGAAHGPSPWLGLPALGVAAALVLVAVGVRGLLRARDAGAEARPAIRAGLLVTAALFAGVMAVWARS